MTPRTKRLWGPVLAIAVLSVIIAFVTSALRRDEAAPYPGLARRFIRSPSWRSGQLAVGGVGVCS